MFELFCIIFWTLLFKLSHVFSLSNIFSTCLKLFRVSIFFLSFFYFCSWVFVMIRIFPRGNTAGARKPNDYSLADCARGVDEIRIIFKFRNPLNFQRPIRCGRQRGSSRKRRSLMDYDEVNHWPMLKTLDKVISTIFDRSF